MNLTRRDAALLGAAAMLAPRPAIAEAPQPLIFAEPGARAPSRAALEDAVGKGADFLVAPVAPSSDGGLIAAPDAELSAFTNVAERADFADRRKERTVDGAPLSGWFSEDFTLAELQSLLTGPAMRGGRALAAPPTLLSLSQVIEIARAGSVGAARVVGVSPRLVHPVYFAAQELNLEQKLANLIRLEGYDSPAAAMIVQAWEPQALRALGDVSRVRRIQLIDIAGGPADPTVMRYQAMTSSDGLQTVRSWANAIGPAEPLLIQPGARGAIMGTELAAAAHAAGLAVFARARSPAPHDPYGAPRTRLMALFLAGADAVMCDDVALAAKARNDAMDRLHLRRD